VCITGPGLDGLRDPVLHCEKRKGEMEACNTPLDVRPSHYNFVRIAHCTTMESGGSLDDPMSFDVCSE